MNKSAVQLVADIGGQTWHAQAPAPLRHLITGYLGRRSNGPCERFTVFPHAGTELLFNFGSPYLTSVEAGHPLRALADASLFAPKAVRNEHQCGPKTDWFLVQLSLSGCLTLLGESASDLVQVDRPLSNLLGSAADELHGEMKQAPSFHAQCAVFSAWASTRVRRRLRESRVSDFCEFARRTPVRTVAEIADRLGMGTRRLRDVFVAEVGLNPKQWLSIMRAERLWTGLHPNAGCSPIATEYADQAHAHRDFKFFTGLTIGEYVRIKSTGDGLVNGGAREVVPLLTLPPG